MWLVWGVIGWVAFWAYGCMLLFSILMPNRKNSGWIGCGCGALFGISFLAAVAAFLTWG
jgi:hypothetical protein